MQMQNFTILELLLVVLIFALYFLPTLIAFLRQHKNKSGDIFVKPAFGLDCVRLGGFAGLVGNEIKTIRVRN